MDRGRGSDVHGVRVAGVAGIWRVIYWPVGAGGADGVVMQEGAMQ